MCNHCGGDSAVILYVSVICGLSAVEGFSCVLRYLSLSLPVCASGNLQDVSVAPSTKTFFVHPFMILRGRTPLTSSLVAPRD